MDLRSRYIRDMRTCLAIPASLSSITPLSLNRVDAVHNDFTKLLVQFPELTTKGETVKHGIAHKIVTKGHPVFARPQWLAPDKLVTAKRELDDMIKLGVIEPSDSEWSSRKMATGDHVAIIEVWKLRPYLINNRSRTFKTLRSVWLVQKFSLKLI